MSGGDGGRKNLRMPEDDEVFATVTNMLGANRVTVRCADGTERTARIRQDAKARLDPRDDVVLVEPWDWRDEKADITWRYEKSGPTSFAKKGIFSKNEVCATGRRRRPSAKFD